MNPVSSPCTGMLSNTLLCNPLASSADSLLTFSLASLDSLIKRVVTLMANLVLCELVTIGLSASSACLPCNTRRDKKVHASLRRAVLQRGEEQVVVCCWKDTTFPISRRLRGPDPEGQKPRSWYLCKRNPIPAYQGQTTALIVHKAIATQQQRSS